MILLGCSKCSIKESNFGLVLGQRGTLKRQKEETSETKRIDSDRYILQKCWFIDKIKSWWYICM